MSGLGAPQQLRTSRTRPVPQPKTVEAAVSEAQHALSQLAEHARCQRLLTSLVGPGRDVDQRVRAALAKPDQPQLRKRTDPLTTARTRPPELRIVRGSVGDIQTGAIDAHQ